MSSDSSSLADRVRNKLKLRSKSGFEKFMDYSKKNIYVAGGFTAGVFKFNFVKRSKNQKPKLFVVPPFKHRNLAATKMS